jgi:hypothetical protein
MIPVGSSDLGMGLSNAPKEWRSHRYAYCNDELFTVALNLEANGLFAILRLMTLTAATPRLTNSITLAFVLP